MARLNTYVHVHHKNGESHSFGPNDELPPWAVQSITNPNVWAEPPTEQELSSGGRRRSEPTAATGPTPTTN